MAANSRSVKVALSRRTWMLIVLGMLLAMVAQMRPIDDVDLFWQIRLGELMLDTGRLVTRDPFTSTHHDQPVPNVGWLAQLVFAQLYRLGSWYTVQIFHAILFAGAFVVGAASVRRTEAGLFSVAAAVVLGFLVSITQCSVRPQSFAILGFALVLALARSEIRPACKLLLAVPVVLVWQNAHPSVLVGAAALAPLVLVKWVHFFRNREMARPVGLSLLMLLVAVSQFATPMGVGIMETTRINQRIARDLLGISEWLPPWDAQVRSAMLVFWLALAVSLLLLVLVRFRVDLGELGLFVVLTLLSLYGARFTLFWAVALVPVWARWIEVARPATLFNWSEEGEIDWRGLAATVVVGSCAVFGLPPLWRGPIVSDQLPLAGIQHLKAVLPKGRIYNYREWGGPLILEGSPDWQVAVDGRLYLFSPEEWRRYEDVARGEVPVDVVVRENRPDAFFLRPSYHATFIELLLQDGEWEQIHADKVCCVFVRRDVTVHRSDLVGGKLALGAGAGLRGRIPLARPELQED